MIPRIVDYLGRFTTRNLTIMSILLLCLISWAYYIAGNTASMAPFYLVPIALISLRSDRKVGVLVAAVSGAAWVYLDYEHRIVSGMKLWPDVWNVMIRVGVFVLFALILSRIKRDIMKELQLNTELQAALDEVKQLSGLLPICAWCKRIRDEGGNWEPIETYITVHSEADFTHGICPDCARRYHPNAQST
jgi:hypothetical protein